MSVKIIECPRDAMQGIKTFISTESKINYLNCLLKAGFHTLDFGSFVSPAAIPQMADTVQVLAGLNLENSTTKLLAIVANQRGAEDAVAFDEIHYIGYPFSLSETFQQRNTRRSVQDSLLLVNDIQDLCLRSRKELVVYLSMGFGNPYGDPWSVELVLEYSEKISALGVKIISLADTVGNATPEIIESVFAKVIPAFPDIEIGAHFHSTPDKWEAKINAAYTQGCRRFDGAIKGFGGCPFAEDTLTGNIATENLIRYLQSKGEDDGIDRAQFEICVLEAGEIFKHS